MKAIAPLSKDTVPLHNVPPHLLEVVVEFAKHATFEGGDVAYLIDLLEMCNFLRNLCMRNNSSIKEFITRIHCKGKDHARIRSVSNGPVPAIFRDPRHL